ncbi:MAG: hypothetical protein ABEL04_03570 [Salinibacter sp.]
MVLLEQPLVVYVSYPQSVHGLLVITKRADWRPHGQTNVHVQTGGPLTNGQTSSWMSITAALRCLRV